MGKYRNEFEKLSKTLICHKGDSKGPQKHKHLL